MVEGASRNIGAGGTDRRGDARGADRDHDAWPAAGGVTLRSRKSLTQGQEGILRPVRPLALLAAVWEIQDIFMSSMWDIFPLCALLRVGSEERSVGKALVSTCRFRWSPYY